MSAGFIHCNRCGTDVATQEYSEHLFDHLRQGHTGKLKTECELQRHKLGAPSCLAAANLDTRKHPEFRGQRKKAKAALLKAQKEAEEQRQEEARKREELEKREFAKREASALARAVITGRSQGNPYSALTITKGKRWKGRVKVISGGSPGSKR